MEDNPSPLKDRSELRDKIYPTLDGDISPTPQIVPVVDNNLEITRQAKKGIVSILIRLIAIGVIAAVIGGIFGRDVVPATGYMSELHNYLVGGFVIGTAAVLFGISFMIFDYWYIYPVIGYALSNIFITRDKIIEAGAADISERLFAILGMFGVYSLIYVALQVILVVKKHQSTTVSYKAGLAAYILCIFSIPLIINGIYKDYTALGTRLIPHLSGIEFIDNNTDGAIRYKDFYATQELDTSNGKEIDKRYVYDTIIFRQPSRAKIDSACKYAYEPNTPGDDTKAYAFAKTPKGITYGFTTLTVTVSKTNNNTDKHADQAMYCFYSDRYSYTIKRLLGSEDTLPKKDIYEKAHAAFPIETVIDSFFQ